MLAEKNRLSASYTDTAKTKNIQKKITRCTLSKELSSTQDQSGRIEGTSTRGLGLKFIVTNSLFRKTGNLGIIEQNGQKFCLN